MPRISGFRFDAATGIVNASATPAIVAWTPDAWRNAHAAKPIGSSTTHAAHALRANQARPRCAIVP